MHEAGKKLLAWRLERGLSQLAAAELGGLTKAAWHSYENGASPKAPAIDAIQRLTDGKVSLEDWRVMEEEKIIRRARTAARRVRRPRRSTPPRAA